MNNITTYFHPSVVSTMRSGAVSSCIPNWNSNSFATVFYDDFEVGGLAANGWTKVYSRRKSDSAHEGNKGAKVRKSGSIRRTVDTSGFGEVVVRYWRRTKNYDAGEELRLRYSTNGGSSWTTATGCRAVFWVHCKGSFCFSEPRISHPIMMVRNSVKLPVAVPVNPQTQ